MLPTKLTYRDNVIVNCASTNMYLSLMQAKFRQAGYANAASRYHVSITLSLHLRNLSAFDAQLLKWHKWQRQAENAFFQQ